MTGRENMFHGSHNILNEESYVVVISKENYIIFLKN